MAVAIAAGAALAACGAGTPTATAATATVVARSYATTMTAGTADVALSTTLTAGSRTLTSFTASGAIDYTDHAWEIHFGNGQQLGDNVIRVGSYVYTEAMVPGRSPVTWLRQTPLRSPVNKVPSYDPSEAISYLQHISPRVTDVGHDSVRGVPVEHYRTTVNLTQLPEVTTTASGRGSMVVTNEQAAPFDVWVDHQGRVRRLDVSVETKTKTSEPACDACQDLVVGRSYSTAAVTIEFFNFGVPVDIRPPPGAVDG